MECYYIYKFTNKKNGLVYIGQSKNPEKRKMEHLYGRKNKSDTYFDRILKKYPNDFNFEVIDKANSQKKVDKLEKKYIDLYNSIKPNGYNICKGGGDQQGAWNSKAIDEYDLSANFLNTYESASYYSSFVNTDYLCRQIRRSCQLKVHYKDRIFRFHGDEKPEPYIKPLPNHRTVVNQFDLNGNPICSYSSVTEASRRTNTSRTSIMGCLSGIYKTANNFVWSINSTVTLEVNPKVIRTTEIYMCDENKKIIKKYYNSREAERDNNFKYNSYKQILRYLDTNKMYKGFYWYKVCSYNNIISNN